MLSENKSHDSLYEDSAIKYDELLVKQRFARPAHDLIKAMNLSSGITMLDIGTGTGAALFPALKAIEPNGVIIGLDPSEEMLNIAKSKGASILIKGKIPGSPFLDDSFDAISANFVLSHIGNFKDGLIEILRLLKPLGLFGTTTWREGQTEYNNIWNHVCKSYINENAIQEINKENIPWETWFETELNIRAALIEAGFIEIKIQAKEYQLPMTLSDYLECRYVLLTGKFIQKILSLSKWTQFREEMYHTFYKMYGDKITYISRVYIILANKPGNSTI